MFNNRMARTALYFVVLAVIVAAAAFYAYSASRTSTSNSSKISPSNNAFVSLTDPANVPSGTTVLNVTYSGIKVHVSGGSSSGWINVNGSGTLNLLSLVNITTVLGTLHLNNGSVIDKVGFNITSASIDVNNTISPVVLSSDEIISNVSTSAGVNGTANILVDLSPTIITVFTANSTVFILVPSVRAVMVGANQIHAIGERSPIPTEARKDFEDLMPNVTMSGVSLSSSGNVSHVSFTATDNSNKTAILQHLLIFGNFSTNLNLTAISNVVGDVTGNIVNRSEIDGAETAISQAEAQAFRGFRALDFFISADGTLLLPFTQMEGPRPTITTPCTTFPNLPIFSGPVTNITPSAREDIGSIGPNNSVPSAEYENHSIEVHINDCIAGLGYALLPGSSHTFSFNGPISMGFGRLLINFITGNDYIVTLQGKNGVHVTANSTAT